MVEQTEYGCKRAPSLLLTSILHPSDAEDVQRPPAGAGASRLAVPAVHGADDGRAETVRVVRHHHLPLRRTIPLRNAPYLEVGG